MVREASAVNNSVLHSTEKLLQDGANVNGEGCGFQFRTCCSIFVRVTHTGLYTHEIMQQHIQQLLSESRTIAVVGLSEKPHRMSYQIAEALRHYGYEIVPINPLIRYWNDLPAYPDLHSAPQPIDIVNVFRRSEHLAEIVDEAIATGARAIWTQVGVVDRTAAARAEAAGLQVVMDSCIALERARLLHSP